jgi:hypothetical protein
MNTAKHNKNAASRDAKGRRFKRRYVQRLDVDRAIISIQNRFMHHF